MILSPIARTTSGSVFVDDPSAAVIAVDVQPTFMPGGGLAVADAHEIVPVGAVLFGRFLSDRRICTRDLHPRGHISLASSYLSARPFDGLTAADIDANPFNRIRSHALFSIDELREELAHGPQTLWPDHALEGTEESRVVHEIESLSSITWTKGTNARRDSYSAFRDNGGVPTGLGDFLRARSVRRVFLFGIAFDVCLGFSALDALDEEFDTIVVTDLCPAISESGAAAMAKRLIDAGVHFAPSGQIIGGS
ncbi:MAG: isochorismatase family protein [Candidatus Uhrbacteria bacterium]